MARSEGLLLRIVLVGIAGNPRRKMRFVRDGIAGSRV